MIGTIIFLSIFILILSMMLKISIVGFLNVEDLTLDIVIKIYKIKIIKISINFNLLSYNVNNGKSKKLKLYLQKKEKYFLLQIKNNILNKLYYDRFYIDATINIIDPAITANLIGNLIVILESLRQVFHMNSEFQVDYNINSNFNSLENNIMIDLCVYFTIFDMLYAIILSFYRKGKYVKENS